MHLTFRFYTALLLILSVHAGAQSYTNMSGAFGLEVHVLDVPFGSGLSSFDFDHDGLDDLTFCTDYDVILYQNNGNGFTEIPVNFNLTGLVKSVAWVDIDNDGDSDLFITQFLGLNALFRNDGNMQFTDISVSAGIQGQNVQHTGQCWGDYDRDGDLDVYITVWANVYSVLTGQTPAMHTDVLYRNNGNGTFSDVTYSAGVSDGLSLTFQGIWMDYNNDQWPDIYNVNDENDPNRLYRNNGDGTFTDVGEESNSAVAEVYAMTATVDDYDGNGYEDIYITNIENMDAVLLKNNGDGTFTEVAFAAGVNVDEWSWGANWIDFDNDRDMDLFVDEYNHDLVHRPNFLFRNGPNNNFLSVANFVLPGDVGDSYTSSIADWNNDGYPDIAVNNVGAQTADAWQSSGGTNHWIKVTPHGVVSNRDGVGTWITCWTAGDRQVRFTHSGENNLSQDSQHELIGLGNLQVVDSLLVDWPSGHRDSFYNLAPDQTYDLWEGSTLANDIIATGSNPLCEGDTILLDAGDHVSYHWNTGHIGRYLHVTQPGEFNVIVTNYLGLADTSATYVVEMWDLPQPVVEHTNVQCYGFQNGSASIINASDFASVLWTGIGDVSAISDLDQGMWSWHVTDLNGCEQDGSVVIQQPDSMMAMAAAADVLCFGGSTGTAVLEISGGTPPYQEDWSGADSQALSAGEYAFAVTDNMGCMASGMVTIGSPSPFEVSILGDMDCEIPEFGNLNVEVSGATPPYTYLWNTGSVEEDQGCLSCGNIYSVEVTDANGCTYVEEGIEVPCRMNEWSEPGVVLYPVPASDVLTVAGNFTHLQVVSAVGQKIGIPSPSSQKGTTRIDLSAVPAGIYFLECESDRGTTTTIPFIRQ